jgi:hypothetical protein
VCQAVCNLVLQNKTNGADCAIVVKLIDCLMGSSASAVDKHAQLVATYKALSNQGQICDVIEHGCSACTSPVTCTNPACSGDQVCLDSGGTKLLGMPPAGLQCCSCPTFIPGTAKCCVRPNRDGDREKAKKWAGTVYPTCGPVDCVCQWDDNPQSSEYWGNGGAPGCATLAVQCQPYPGYICTN